MASIHAIRALESNTTASSDRKVDLPRSSVSPFLGSEPLRAGLSGLACSAPPRGCPAHVVLATLLLQACGGFLPIAQSTPLADDGVEAVHVDATTQDQAMAQVSSGARMEQLAWFELYGEDVQDLARLCLGPEDDQATVHLMFLPEDNGDLVLYEARRGPLTGPDDPDLAHCVFEGLADFPHALKNGKIYANASVFFYGFDP